MERLTIKELAPYLPYGLKVQLSDEGRFNLDSEYPNEHKFKSGLITEFTISDGEFIYGEFKVSDRYYFSFNELSEITLLLRPLSYLTEEIEHNGERFVPIDKLELEGYVIGYNGFSITIGQEDGYSFGYAIDVYNQIIQKLHKWHFDTANLLGLGLALPIDGKEVKP